MCGAAMATGGDLRARKQQKRFLTTCCTKIMASVPSIISGHNSTVLTRSTCCLFSLFMFPIGMHQAASRDGQLFDNRDIQTGNNRCH